MGRDQALTAQRNTVVITRPLARRTAISTAIALAVTPVAVHAGGWTHNSEVFISAGSKRNLLGGRALIPFRQDADSMWYADIRGFVSDESTKEGNIGVGYRQFTDSGDWILGGYLAYDSRESESDTHWDQITLGIEALSDDWDFRANLYHPLDNKELLYTQTNAGGVLTDTSFVGYNLVGTLTGGSTLNFYEEAMDGIDIEVGRLLPFGPANHEIRGYVGLYHFDGDIVKDADGISARLEWRPRRNITVNLEARDDNLFDDQLRLEVAWSFDRPTKAGKRKLRDRMTQFVHRDIDIIETSELPPEERIEKTVSSTSTNQVVATDIVHIDDSKGDTLGVVEGDGSAENPFRSFGECLQAAGAKHCNAGASVQYVYVHAGTGATYDTSDADGDGTGGDASFQLQAGLTLAGEGAAFFTVPAGTAPKLSATGNGGTPVITLLGNNTVQGVTINNDHGNNTGIYAYSTGAANSFTITNNTIENLNDIGILFGSYNSNDTITITNNTIRNNYNGILAYNYAAYGSSTQTVTITGNTFTGNGGPSPKYGGILAANASAYDGVATQNLDITGNTVTGNYSGITLINAGVLDAPTYKYPIAIQTANISGNNISGNAAFGVLGAQKYGSYAPGDVTQTLNVSNNTINGNGYAGSGKYGGVVGINAAAKYGYTSQVFNLTGNGMDGNYNGVVGFNAGLYGVGYQLMNMTGNTITNSTEYGLVGYNVGGYATLPGIAAQYVDMTGGGNTLTGSGGSYDAIIANKYNAAYAPPSQALQVLDMSGGNTVGSYDYVGQPAQLVTPP